MATSKKNEPNYKLLGSTTQTPLGNTKTTYTPVKNTGSTSGLSNVVSSAANYFSSLPSSTQTGVNITPNPTWGGYDVVPVMTDTPKKDSGSKKGEVGDAALNGLGLGGATGVAVNQLVNQPTGGGGGVNVARASPLYNAYGAYTSPYQSQIDELMKAMLNRGPFNYDYLSDPTYQAYRQQYEFQGDRARENAIGDYAANTGGMASSWAQTAGQLAQNNYNAQLNSLIPELQNAAYNKYLGEAEMDLNNLNMLQNLEDANYNRYLNDREYDLQMQQLNNAARTRTSGGGSGGSGSSQSSALGQENASKIASSILAGGIMPSNSDLKEMGTSSSEVNYFLKVMKQLNKGQSNIANALKGGTSIL